MKYKEITSFDVESKIACGETVMMLDRESKEVYVANYQPAVYVFTAIRTSRYGGDNEDRFSFWTEEPDEEPAEEQSEEQEESNEAV